MTADPGWYPPQLAVGVTSSRIRAMCAIDALASPACLARTSPSPPSSATSLTISRAIPRVFGVRS